MNTESYPLSENSRESEFHNLTKETEALDTLEGEESSARRRGRPSRRTPELEAAILECLQLGLTISETCDACGVSETQFRSWRRHCPDFAALVRQGEAEAVKIHLSMIRSAATKSWQASAWWLERRRPDRWSRPPRHTFEDRTALEYEEEDYVDLMDKLRESREMVDVPMRERDEKAAAGAAVPESRNGAAPKPADLPVRGLGVESPEAAAPRVSPSERAPLEPAPLWDSVPMPPDSEEDEAAPPAGRMPSVFICGARSGQPAEFDDGDASTHVQDGYRLRKIPFTCEGQALCLEAFVDPETDSRLLSAEAVRLMQAGNRAILSAVAARESGLLPSEGTNGKYQN